MEQYKKQEWIMDNILPYIQYRSRAVWRDRYGARH